MASLATALIVIGICGLFWLDRNQTRVSRANWVPFFWLFIASSRPISQWTSSPVVGYRNEQYLEGSPLDRMILMALLALGTLILSRRLRRSAGIVWANPVLTLFLLYCLLSVSWTDFPVVSFKRWIRTVGDVVMILVILTDQTPLDAFRWIASRIAYLLAPLSILFIRFYPALGRSYSIGGAPQWTGVSTDKNGLGALCMLFGIVLLWRWIGTYSTPRSAARTRSLIAMGTTLLMMVYLLLTSDSKTALMCTIFAAFVIGLRQTFQKPGVIFTYVVGTVAACYVILILGIGGDVLTSIGRDSSLTGRTRVWANVLRFVQSPWFGTGYESFWLGERLVRLIGAGGNQAHNGYLEIYVNLGWVGVILLGLLILSGYRHIVKTLRINREVTNLKVAFFLICLLYNFSEAAFKMNTPVWLLFLWACMADPGPQPAAAHSPVIAVPIRKPDLLPVAANRLRLQP